MLTNLQRFLTLGQANLAQSVEQHPRNVQVVGSTPIVGSTSLAVIIMNIVSIKETCIYVNDLERTQEFYNKLGLSTIAFVANRHVFFRAGSSVLLCFIADQTLKEQDLPPHGAKGTIHFAFEVNAGDYEGAFQQIKNAGIQILHEHFWKRGIRSFYFHDPDFNLVEIIEQGLWEK